MAKKGKDSRPTRQNQKSRSVDNKKRQLTKHLLKHPDDKAALSKLERVKKSGISRSR